MARDLFADIPGIAQQKSGKDLFSKPEFTAKSDVTNLERAGLSVKITPEGKTSYLQSMYGPENVHVLDNGSAFVKNKEGQWAQVDEPAFTAGDLADIAGPALEAIPASIAGVMTASPVGAGVGGAAGSLLRQAVSSSLPGSDEMSVADRVQMPFVDALIAAGTQGAVNGAFRGVDWAKPRNMVARHVQKQQKTQFAKEGADLNKVGPLTMGQETGSRALLMSEGVARQMPSSADDVFKFDQFQLSSAVGKLDGLLQSFRKGMGEGADTVGSKISTTYKGAVDKVLKIRRMQADVDFGEVSKLSGNSRILPTNNTTSELDRIIADLDVPGGGDATASLVSRIKSLRSKLVGTPEKTVSGSIVSTDGKPILSETIPAQSAKVSANQMNRLLQIYGSASKGTAQLFKDIDKAQQRGIATRLFVALQRDLDEAADTMGEGSVATALKKARDNYRANSQGLGKLEETVIGRMLDSNVPPAPEAIANKFMSMHPSEIRAVVSVLKQADQSSVDSVKRYMLEEIMRKSAPSSSAQTANGIAFSGAKFNTELSKQVGRMKEIYTLSEINQISMVSKYLGRLTDRAGMQGSQTGPFLMVWDAIKGSFSLNPIALGKTTATFLAPRHIAKAMTTPEGRKALLTLSTTTKPTKGAVAAATYLGTLIATDDAPEATEQPQQ